MLRIRNNKASGKTRQPTGRRATMEPMEGRVLMSGTTLGSPVTFTYVVTNTSSAAADYVSAGSPTSFTPDGRQLVVTIKDGPPA